MCGWMCVSESARAGVCSRMTSASAPSAPTADEQSHEIDPAGDVQKSLKSRGKSSIPLHDPRELSISG